MENTIDDFKKFINDHKESAQEIFSSLHPADIADIIEQLSDDKKKEIFNRLNSDLASEVIVEMDDQTREYILEDITTEKLADIVEEMNSDDAANLIRDLPDEDVDNLLKELDEDDSEELRRILKYDPESAGGIMQTEIFSVREGMLVEDVVVKFIAEAEDIGEVGDIHNVYIVNADGVLVGSTPIANLLLHKPTTPIAAFMDKSVVTVNVHMDQEEVARIFEKYDIISAAVVDDDNRLLGRILVDDIVDVIDEEASEDMLKIAGIYRDEHIFDPPVQSVQLRFPWLVFNLITAVMAASIVGYFGDAISSFVVLAAFMPIIAGMGGIAGSQALAVTIRGIALGELDAGNGRKAVYNAALAGALSGLITGVLTAAVAYVWKKNIIFTMIIFATMFLNVFIGTLFGVLIPIILKKVKIDPAASSAVFLTTFTDCLGFFALLGLSTLLIKHLVH